MRHFPERTAVAAGRREAGRAARACAALALVVCGCGPSSPAEPPRTGPADDAVAATEADRARYPVVIRRPAGSPRVATGLIDEHGRPVTVACGTCHATRPANPEARLGQPPADFHQHVAGPHGNLTCVACHSGDDGYESLHLADGRRLEFPDAIALCAQCHGPQYRDYTHGAHGGMTGFWDLTRGGRFRNTCTDCHAPHAPSYPAVLPAPEPHDRIPVGSLSRHE